MPHQACSSPTQGQVADDGEENADGVVLVKKPVVSVHEFYFSGYVHNVKVCHIVHTATARTQMTFSACLSNEAASLCTSTSAARAAPASSRSSLHSEDKGWFMLFSQARESLGRAFRVFAKARMKVVIDKVFRAQYCERCRSKLLPSSRQIAGIQESGMPASPGNPWKDKWVP